MNIHCINVVWGKEYVRLFLDYSLPLQLAPGNLDALKGLGKYRIFTTRCDWEIISSDPIFSQLSQAIETEFIPIETPRGRDPVACANLHHRQAVAAAGKEDAALIFLCPDIALSQNAFPRIVAAMHSGKRVVTTLSVRVLKQTFCSLYKGKGGLSPRSLVRFAMQSLHPFSQTLFWNPIRMNAWPSHLYWKLDEENLLARGFHLHPLFVWPQNKMALPDLSVDYDFALHACPLMDQWEVIEDSDELAVFEMSGQELQRRIGYMPGSFRLLGLWVHKHTAPLHRFFSSKRIYIHSCDKKENWDAIAQASDLVVGKIASLSANPSTLAHFLSLGYRARNKLKRMFSYRCFDV